MKLFFIAFLIVMYTHRGYGQKDTVNKTSFISMLNYGTLNPNKTWTEEFIGGNAGYQNFIVEPKNGVNSNLLMGISIEIKKMVCLENLIGYGYSSDIYFRKGFSENYYSVQFRGNINTTINEHRILLSNGISISNPNKIGNKLYFSNYFITNLTFFQKTYTESYNQIDNKKNSSVHVSSIHYRQFSFNTTHIFSYGIQWYV